MRVTTAGCENSRHGANRGLTPMPKQEEKKSKCHPPAAKFKLSLRLKHSTKLYETLSAYEQEQKMKETGLQFCSAYTGQSLCKLQSS